MGLVMVLGEQVLGAMWKLVLAEEKIRFAVLMILQMMVAGVMVRAQLLVLRKHLLGVPQTIFVVWTILRMMLVDLVMGKHLLLIRQAIFVGWMIPRMMVLESALVLWLIRAWAHSVRHDVLGLPGGMRFVIGLLRNHVFFSQAK
jgi:hypothetical protein